MQDQAATAAWLGYGTDAFAVQRLNEDHDPLHRALCARLGITSQSMRIAAGEQLTQRERDLAAYEEDAVLMIQRLAMHAGCERATLT